MLSEAISSANCEKSGQVRQDTGQNSKTMNMTRGPYTTLSATKTFFPHHEAILIQVLWFHVVDDVERLITKSGVPMPPVLCHLSLPLRTVFVKILLAKSNFPLIREIYSPRNISAVGININLSLNYQSYTVTTIQSLLYDIPLVEVQSKLPSMKVNYSHHHHNQKTLHNHIMTSHIFIISNVLLHFCHTFSLGFYNTRSKIYEKKSNLYKDNQQNKNDADYYASNCSTRQSCMERRIIQKRLCSNSIAEIEDCSNRYEKYKKLRKVRYTYTCTCIKKYGSIKKCSSTPLVGMGQVQNGHLHIWYRNSSTKIEQKNAKSSTDYIPLLFYY